MNTDIPPFIGREPGKKQWTAAFFRAQMRGAWRRIWFRWPGRNLALQAARVEILTRKKSSEGYKKNVWYKCSACDKMGKPIHTKKQTAELKEWKAFNKDRTKLGMPLLEYPATLPLKVAVDHREPLVPTDGSVLSWDQYLFRLFCGPDELQVLCSECHKLKTRTENTERRLNVKARSSPK